MSIEKIFRDRLTALLAELEQENGPIEPQVMEEVRQAWPAPGEKSVILTGDREDLELLAAPHAEVWIQPL